MVVDATGFRLGEGVVGFGDLDEFFGGGFVAAAETKGVSIGFSVEWILFYCDSDTGGIGHGAGTSSRILIGVVFLAEEAVGFLDLSI